MEGPQPELSGHGSSRRRAMGQLGSREDRSMTRYERQKLRQRLTFHGSQFERGDGSSLDALLRALDLIDQDRKSTRLNSSHVAISYAVFCLKKKIKTISNTRS